MEVVWVICIATQIIGVLNVALTWTPAAPAPSAMNITPAIQKTIAISADQMDNYAVPAIRHPAPLGPAILRACVSAKFAIPAENAPHVETAIYHAARADFVIPTACVPKVIVSPAVDPINLSARTAIALAG
jgi:hypothetical protein